jgi:hypothetical protein
MTHDIHRRGEKIFAEIFHFVMAFGGSLSKLEVRIESEAL